jgi:acetate---CoA ligase (ADP-forming)
MNDTATGQEASSAVTINDRLFRPLRPRSIAIVGASETPGTLIAQVFENMRNDFPGKIKVVNPTKDTVFGEKTFASVSTLPPTDLIVVMVAAARVPGIIEECAKAGHGGAYIISAGFVEAGPEGALLQDRIAEIAKANAFPVFGPNCVGYLNRFEGVMANFALGPEAERPVAGPIGLISQSGGVGSFMLSRFMEHGLGVGLFATTGNECDMSLSELAGFFLEQPEINMVAVFAETIRQPEAFIRAAKRALVLDKPIVVFRPPASIAAARASMAHTGSTVIAPEVFDAICDQYGVLRVDSIEDCVDLAVLLQTGRRMAGPRVGVLTVTGGMGLLMAGQAEEQGLTVNRLGEATEQKIAALCPSFASILNPVDTTPAIHPWAAYSDVLDILLEDDEIDAAITYAWSHDHDFGELTLKSNVKTDKPIATVITFRPEAMSARGVPAYSDPQRAAKAIAALYRFSCRKPLPVDQPFIEDSARAASVRSEFLRSGTGGVVGDSDGKQALAAYGIGFAADAEGESFYPLSLSMRRDPVFGPMVKLKNGAANGSFAPILLRAPFGPAHLFAAAERHNVMLPLSDGVGLTQEVAEAASNLGLFALEQPSVSSVEIDQLLVSKAGVHAAKAIIKISPK